MACKGKGCIDHKNNRYDSLKDMARAYSLTYQQFRNRYFLCGWSLERALTTPLRNCQSHKYHNEYIDHLGNKYKTLTIMISKYNISMGTYVHRKSQGWDIERILTTPIMSRGVKCKK